jgi:hypothetical protein
VETQPTVTDMMVAYAQDAVDHAQANTGVALDYSVDSVKHVEEILEQLHASLPRGLFGKLFGKGPTPETIDTIAKMYGGYVGEVLRRAAGGEWSFDDEIVPGQKAICLSKGDARIWPTIKVHKRIANGSEDNVWFYLRVVMQRW